MKSRKKLIEVALPLDAINKASAREKSIRHGHPSTLHLWWARRPLAAARAVIFAQMVDDPSAWPELFPTEEEQEKERQRLFGLIEELVKWENTTNEKVLQKARDEILRSWRRTCEENADHPRAAELFNPDKLPAFHDPFAGGGSLPLEAQRLGLKAHASDLNPVAVLICKAMLEIPPKFSGKPPVNPDWQSKTTEEKALRTWKGAQGLAEDVRYYGRWMRDEARKRIGHLYPPVEVTEGLVSDPGNPRPDLKAYVGRKLTVIAWLWARTVRSPNPAFANIEVPLVTNFMLATKPGKEAYVEPVVKSADYRFTVKAGKPQDPESVKKGTKLSRGANFRCLMSGTPIQGDYIKSEARSGRMGARLMVVVAEGDRERVYLPPTRETEDLAGEASPVWRPDVEFLQGALGFRVGNYGMTRWSDLYTPRQTVALTMFSDLVQEARERVQIDALAAGLPDGSSRTAASARTYADSVAVYLGLSASKAADNNSTICQWMPGIKYEVVAHTFARNAVPMSWDYAESNPFAGSSGDFYKQVKRMLSVFAVSLSIANSHGWSTQADAQSGTSTAKEIISTDPPYYDNIGYADLSDFFYVWLRRSLRPVFPELFSTVTVPKAEELVATPDRQGGRDEAEAFFVAGMTRAMQQLANQSHPSFPVTIYYAFKQSETQSDSGTASTGWETFLGAVISAGLEVSGTWPIRTERGVRSRGIGSNALASSIVLVCRPRLANAPSATRRELVSALKAELPDALAHLQRSNIAPVDLAQAAIGPGMAVYTRYSQVLSAAGDPVAVREALALINQVLDEVLAEQESDFDADTRWALSWFEHAGFAPGEYGVAETLSKAKNTSISGLVAAGILATKGGKVRLLGPQELPPTWDPTTDARLTVWEMVHQLVRVLEAEGEAAAAELTAKLGSEAEVARELAYRLYTLCERKKRAPEALSYNGLVQSWPEIQRLARERPGAPMQHNLFSDTETDA